MCFPLVHICYQSYRPHPIYLLTYQSNYTLRVERGHVYSGPRITHHAWPTCGLMCTRQLPDEQTLPDIMTLLLAGHGLMDDNA